MIVVYTTRALSQLDEILNYIEHRNSTGARHVKTRLQSMIELLENHPMAGREASRAGQRRLVISPYPDVVFYRLFEHEVVIQRIRHTSRRPV